MEVSTEWKLKDGAHDMAISQTMVQLKLDFDKVTPSVGPQQWFRPMFEMAQSDDQAEWDKGPYCLAKCYVNGVQTNVPVVLLWREQVDKKKRFYDRPKSPHYGGLIHKWWQYVANRMEVAGAAFIVAYNNVEHQHVSFPVSAPDYSRFELREWIREKP